MKKMNQHKLFLRNADLFDAAAAAAVSLFDTRFTHHLPMILHFAVMWKTETHNDVKIIHIAENVLEEMGKMQLWQKTVLYNTVLICGKSFLNFVWLLLL
jgi:hypothetical protein